MALISPISDNDDDSDEEGNFDLMSATALD